MAKFIRFFDIEGEEHIVNADYIVQIYTRPKTDGYCNRIGTHYIVNVACAGVAVYHAGEYDVEQHVYETIKKEL